MNMPSRTSTRVPKEARGTDAAAPNVRMAPGAIGTIVSTDGFHCVRARDSATFYKVLAQLK